jgi:hypothetical protein
MCLDVATWWKSIQRSNKDGPLDDVHMATYSNLKLNLAI